MIRYYLVHITSEYYLLFACLLLTIRSCYLLLALNYPLLTTKYSLPTTHYLLLTTYCLLPTTHEDRLVPSVAGRERLSLLGLRPVALPWRHRLQVRGRLGLCGVGWGELGLAGLGLAWLGWAGLGLAVI